MLLLTDARTHKKVLQGGKRYSVDQKMDYERQRLQGAIREATAARIDLSLQHAEAERRCEKLQGDLERLLPADSYAAEQDPFLFQQSLSPIPETFLDISNSRVTDPPAYQEGNPLIGALLEGLSTLNSGSTWGPGPAPPGEAVPVLPGSFRDAEEARASSVMEAEAPQFGRATAGAAGSHNDPSGGGSGAVGTAPSAATSAAGAATATTAGRGTDTREDTNVGACRCPQSTGHQQQLSALLRSEEEVLGADGDDGEGEGELLGSPKIPEALFFTSCIVTDSQEDASAGECVSDGDASSSKRRRVDNAAPRSSWQRQRSTTGSSTSETSSSDSSSSTGGGRTSCSISWGSPCTTPTWPTELRYHQTESGGAGGLLSPSATAAGSASSFTDDLPALIDDLGILLSQEQLSPWEADIQLQSLDACDDEAALSNAYTNSGRGEGGGPAQSSRLLVAHNVAGGQGLPELVEAGAREPVKSSSLQRRSVDSDVARHASNGHGGQVGARSGPLAGQKINKKAPVTDETSGLRSLKKFFEKGEMRFDDTSNYCWDLPGGYTVVDNLIFPPLEVPVAVDFKKLLQVLPLREKRIFSWVKRGEATKTPFMPAINRTEAFRTRPAYQLNGRFEERPAFEGEQKRSHKCFFAFCAQAKTAILHKVSLHFPAMAKRLQQHFIYVIS